MTELRLVLAGAAVGNGNRGVEALARSVLDGVDRHGERATVSVLDDGWGVRDLPEAGCQRLRCELVGVRRSRRWYRKESWAQVRFAQTVRWGNPVADRLLAADAVLDISGGDSFTDLYGAQRLAAIIAPKQAAIRARRPLVLLPQTYGPFSTLAGRRDAERVLRGTSLAYARDQRSHDLLLDLAGPNADRARLRRGVDVAFALEPRLPASNVSDRVRGWADETTAGVNVSGLLGDAAGHARFMLAGDYLATVTELVRGLIAEGALVVFVPHVHLAGGLGESDLSVIEQVRDRLDAPERARTTTLPTQLGASEVKWCISQLDWFVGSRMHATIAALSTLTPAAAFAYSDKTLGVFETCGMGSHVVDARLVHGPDAVSRLQSSFRSRDETRTELEEQVPATVDAAHAQLREIMTVITRWSHGVEHVGSIS